MRSSRSIRKDPRISCRLVSDRSTRCSRNSDRTKWCARISSQAAGEVSAISSPTRVKKHFGSGCFPLAIQETTGSCCFGYSLRRLPRWPSCGAMSKRSAEINKPVSTTTTTRASGWTTPRPTIPDYRSGSWSWSTAFCSASPACAGQNGRWLSGQIETGAKTNDEYVSSSEILRFAHRNWVVSVCLRWCIPSQNQFLTWSARQHGVLPKLLYAYRPSRLMAAHSRNDPGGTGAVAARHRFALERPQWLDSDGDDSHDARRPRMGRDVRLPRLRPAPP